MNEVFYRDQCKNKEEWLEKRKFGVGGTGASCVVGQNPYQTNLQYWKEKMGLSIPEDISNKPNVEYGIKAEAPIREIFKLDYKDKLNVYHREFELIIRKDKPYIRVSLDGELEVLEDFKFMSYWKPFYNKNATDEVNIVPDPIDLVKGMKGILEIKTTEVASSMHKEKWHNTIPMQYYSQDLQQLLATGYDFVILRAQLKHRDNNGVVTLDTRDYGFLRAGREADLEYLEKEIDYFWLENIQKSIEPPLKIIF